jgi:assimilatory nitrate reductase electron transfer subunit
VAAGVRAKVALADWAGLPPDGGMVIDDCLRSSDPRIYAIGDCAQHPNALAGLVQPAWEQAKVLADLLTGADSAARYRGTSTVTRLKARGIDLAALGDVHAEAHGETDEVVCLTDPTRGRYAKLVLRDDKVRGAILLGVPDAAATVSHHYDNGTPAPSDRLALLLGRALPREQAAADNPATMPGSVTVCKCNNVTKSSIVDAWRGGARNCSAIAEATRATTGCGGCTDVVDGIVTWLASTA